MHNHFDQFLDLKNVILTEKPSVIVECGAGEGDCTRKIASLMDEVGFGFTVVTDHAISGFDPRINFVFGVSYREIPKFADNSVDLCVIDTDHNYWTLFQELGALHTKLKENGLIALHDVGTFYHNTGMAESYSDGSEYPRKDIEEYGRRLGGLGDAVIDFLSLNRLKYRMERFVPESHGACLIRKNSVIEFTYFVPGNGAVYANAK